MIVVYLQRPNKYGGTSWFTIIPGLDYAAEMVDIVSAKRSVCCAGTVLCRHACLSFVVGGMPEK